MPLRIKKKKKALHFSFGHALLPVRAAPRRLPPIDDLACTYSSCVVPPLPTTIFNRQPLS